MTYDSNELVRRLLAIYCDSVSLLSYRLLDQGNDLSIILKLVRPLEELAREIGESNTNAQRLLLNAVYSLQEYVFEERGDHAAVVERCRLGMEVTDSTETSHYLFAAGMARAYFVLGQMENGYTILGMVIDRAIASGVAKVEATGLCHIATMGDVNCAKATPDFVSAVLRFAKFRGFSEVEFRPRLMSEPLEALMSLARTDANGP